MTTHTYAGHTLDEIKAAAEAATPGEWRFENVKHGNGLELVTSASTKYGLLYAHSDHGNPRLAYRRSEDMHHIATANPTTVLAMAARIEELERDAARLDWLVRTGAQIVNGSTGFFLYWHTSSRRGPLAGTPRAAIDAAMEPTP